ncbi:MAG: cytochrome c3 family protein [Acidobacteria bacterium]|nr:cytochrome c3 family protein [Acidobacteriota bacterium]
MQEASRHANALKPFDGTGFAGKTLRERGGTVFSYSDKRVAITRDGVRREAVMQWLFGAGHFARTPVFKQDGKWVEHRISQYPGAGRLSLTPGHVAQPSPSFDVAFGIVQSEANAERCFGCHSTNVSEPGVHCQRCHGEGQDHPAQATIRRTKDIALCAECHRSPNREYASPEPEIEDPGSIRFAPVGLMASKCYTASKGALTCVTCHDPHTDAKVGPGYDKNCLICHSPGPKNGCGREPNCASCHMPKSGPIPLLTFTDHRIR